MVLGVGICLLGCLTIAESSSETSSVFKLSLTPVACHIIGSQQLRGRKEEVEDEKEKRRETKKDKRKEGRKEGRGEGSLLITFCLTALNNIKTKVQAEPQWSPPPAVRTVYLPHCTRVGICG